MAHNILLSDSRIDSEKIGITGISWGANITSQVIAYDRRFAFAIPVYGSGYLHFSLTKTNISFKAEKALNFWEVSSKYSKINFPILWLCWNNDICFDILPNGCSYLATKNAGAVLSVCNDMTHGHVGGWIREESYRFADSVTSDALKFVRIKNEENDFFEEKYELDCDIKARNIEATLYYIMEEYTYNENSEPNFQWKTINAKVENNYVQIKIPQDAKAYYIELKEKIGDKEYISTNALKVKR